MQRSHVRLLPAIEYKRALVQRIAVIATAVFLTFLALAGRAGAMTALQADGIAGPTPSASLTPDSVVAIVLSALSRNDMPVKDRGISVTFAFSSPANRAFVGPVESFGDLVHDATYRPLLNHRRAERGVAHVSGARATERVVITTASGERVAYVFALSLQEDGEYKGCWMTDGVSREPPSPLRSMRSA